MSYSDITIDETSLALILHINSKVFTTNLRFLKTNCT